MYAQIVSAVKAIEILNANAKQIDTTFSAFHPTIRGADNVPPVPLCIYNSTYVIQCIATTHAQNT